MKKPIHSFPLESLRWFSLSLLLAINLVNEKVSAQHVAGDITSTDEFRLYNSLNEPYAMSKDSNYLIILKNYRSCLQCFKSIEDYLMQFKNINKVCYIVASCIDSSALERKKQFAINKRLLPSCDEYLFIYEAHSSFRTNTYYTPEVILMKKGEMERLPYADLFVPGTTEISDEAKSRLSQLLID